MTDQVCAVEGCTKVRKTREWCGMHYQRWRNRGSTDDPPKRGATRAELVRVRAARRPATPVTCRHPDRQHFGKGLCKPCYMTQWIKAHPHANTGNEWLRRNPEQAALHKRKNVLKKHGITIDQYAAMWLAQDGCCANPNCDFTAALIVPDYRRGLQVDHDHATGLLRKLLCPGCNLALGCVNDGVGRLLGLVEYLGVPLN